ncbi:MAG TPA: zf-HC2 domain-containing protein [Verrucomicrobiae bacterium]|jgi:hypothetical protein|nr:zf-HC2 domain-containing protein [Verrucomicrobiae bacterium]
MSCEETELRILEHQENQLSPALREKMETHLADCASCRMFARQLQRLDAALSAGIQTPVLSANFDQRLAERIGVGSRILSEAERAERKRALQAEFEAGQARLGRGLFGLDGLMRHLIWPALAVVFGWLAWQLTLDLTTHITAQSLGGLDPRLLPWLTASTVCLAVGLVELYREAAFLRSR